MRIQWCNLCIRAACVKLNLASENITQLTQHLTGFKHRLAYLVSIAYVLINHHGLDVTLWLQNCNLTWEPTSRKRT